MAQVLVGYASSADEDNGKAGSSDDSYFVGSEAESDDSATRRRKEAESRLTDATASSSGRGALPDPLSALGQVSRKPAFLTPEATKPIAAPVHRSRPPLAPAQAGPGAQRGDGGAAAPFDIASMAPPLKGQTDAGRRGLPEGAVISAAAKRYKVADEDDGGVVSAAQIAMLGGQWKPSADDDDGGDLAGPLVLGPAAPQQQPGKKPSRAMGVSEFMDKGVGGAQLPRRRQERKDKEKQKRQLGQSAIGSWKTEAEMMMRQLYDS